MNEDPSYSGFKSKGQSKPSGLGDILRGLFRPAKPAVVVSPRPSVIVPTNTTVVGPPRPSTITSPQVI